MSSVPPDPYVTQKSIFLRLNAPQTRQREIAWEEFEARYAPIIAGFARNLGANRQEIDDVIQEVMLGFYKASPNFKYEPANGRFRGYLKSCTVHVILSDRKRRSRLKFSGLPVEDVQASQPDLLNKLWEAQWEEHIVGRAVNEVRLESQGNRVFQAFERYVLQGEDPASTAQRLGMSVESVYAAKTRMLRQIRDRVKQISEEE